MKISIPITIIYLKSKEEVRIKRETGDKIQKELANADQHIFIRIEELNRTINSTEIKDIKNSIRFEERSDKQEVGDKDHETGERILNYEEIRQWYRVLRGEIAKRVDEKIARRNLIKNNHV